MTTFSKKNPSAVVLGMGMPGLAIARSLGRRGIPVIGVDVNEYKFGSFSRYWDHRILAPDPIKHESAFLASLLSLSAETGVKGVLFPTSDDSVFCISKNRATLADHYVLILPEEGVIEQVNDKLSLCNLALKHGIGTPKTYEAGDLGSLMSLSDHINYPCIIKRRFGHSREVLSVKAVACSEKGELVENYKKVASLAKQIIIQEVVPGTDEENYSMCSYCDKDSEPLAIVTTRKVRQRPRGFGVGTLVASWHEPEVAELGRILLKKLRYHGISEVEFKRDTRDGHFKVIEINTRPWDQIGLATRCGVNMPLIAYRDALGFKQEKIGAFRTDVKWLKPGQDLFTTLGRNGYVSRGELGFMEWMNSLRGEREYAVFSWEDPKPFLVSVAESIQSLIGRRLRAKLRKSLKLISG